MKVYVVAGCHEFEGWDPPHAVYASAEEAEKGRLELEQQGRYDDVSVKEMDLLDAFVPTPEPEPVKHRGGLFDEVYRAIYPDVEVRIKSFSEIIATSPGFKGRFPID